MSPAVSACSAGLFCGVKIMKTQVFTLLAASCLLLLPVAGNAQDAPDVPAAAAHEKRDCAELLAMLEAGESEETVVRAVVETGMSLSEATVYAMLCGGDSYRLAIAVAGVTLSSTLAQAQSVANAVIAAAGDNSDVAIAVREAVIVIAKGLPQPGVYVDEYTPTGGTDVSPAS